MLKLLNCCLKPGAEVNAVTDDNQSALFMPAQNGNVEFVELLIEYGIDGNIQNANKDTGLMFAALYGMTDVVKLLLDYGVDVK